MPDARIPLAFVVVGFALGASVDALNVATRIGKWCCAPPEDAPEVVAGYFAIPLDLIHDFYPEDDPETQSIDLFEALSDFRMIETEIYQTAVSSAYEHSEEVAQLGTDAWEATFGERRGIGYEPYLLVLFLKNSSDRAVSGGTLYSETFTLSNEPRAINQFQIAYDIIDRGCLRDEILPECLLEVGETRPSEDEIIFPELLPGQAIYIPMAHVQVPETFFPEIPMHYLIGSVVFPRRVKYGFGFGESVEIPIREPLRNPYRLEMIPDLLGLG